MTPTTASENVAELVQMKALIVFETWFGGARCAAEAIASGLRSNDIDAPMVNIADMIPALPRDLDLLIIGAPTHQRGLPTPATQTAAAQASGLPFHGGINVWLDRLELPKHVYVALFDTFTGNKFLAGSAAKAMTKVLVRTKHVRPVSCMSFHMSVVQGSLRRGELDRAFEWGRALGLNNWAKRPGTSH